MWSSVLSSFLTCSPFYNDSRIDGSKKTNFNRTICSRKPQKKKKPALAAQNHQQSWLGQFQQKQWRWWIFRTLAYVMAWPLSIKYVKTVWEKVVSMASCVYHSITTLAKPGKFRLFFVFLLFPKQLYFGALQQVQEASEELHLKITLKFYSRKTLLLHVQYC